MKVNIKYSYFKEKLESYKSYGIFKKGEYNKTDKTIELIFDETEEFKSLIKYTDNLKFICEVIKPGNIPFYVSAIDTFSGFHIFNDDQKKQAEKVMIEHFNEVPQILTISMLASRIDYETEDEKQKIKELAKEISKEQKKSRKERINKMMEDKRMKEREEFICKHGRGYLGEIDAYQEENKHFKKIEIGKGLRRLYSDDTSKIDEIINDLESKNYDIDTRICINYTLRKLSELCDLKYKHEEILTEEDDIFFIKGNVLRRDFINKVFKSYAYSHDVAYDDYLKDFFENILKTIMNKKN